jgi:hypothetical protein
MKRNLLEYIIKRALFEDESESTANDKKTNSVPTVPIKITILGGQDAIDYQEAGAVLGFDVKVGKLTDPLLKKELTTGDVFNYIDKWMKDNVQKYYTMLNSEGYFGIASYEFRPSERVDKYRIWIFETNYLAMIISKPFIQTNNSNANATTSQTSKNVTTNQETDKITRWLPTVSIGDAKIGQTDIAFFSTLKLWGPFLLRFLDIKFDTAGLKTYETWYNKLKKINKGIASPDFQYSNQIIEPLSSAELNVTNTSTSGVLGKQYDDTEKTDSSLNRISDVVISVLTADGESRNCIIDYNTTKTEFNADDAIKYKVKLYKGTTSKQIAGRIFASSVNNYEGSIKKINETTFALVTGYLTNWPLYSENSKFKDYEFSGLLRDGNLQPGTTVKVPYRKKEITLDQFNTILQSTKTKKSNK